MTIGSVFARARVFASVHGRPYGVPEVTRACVRERTANKTFYIYIVLNTGDELGPGMTKDGWRAKF